MADEFGNFTAKVTQGDDGVYRWYYDLDMYENKSMLYMLEKINLLIFLVVPICGALFIMAVKGDAAFARGIVLIGLALGALMALLYPIGYYIAAGVKRGNYRIHFAMSEDGIELVWSDRLKQGFGTGEKALSLVGSAIGSRNVRGRYRPTLKEVSEMYFSTVIRYKSYPQWNMIDLSMPGGKFQVYVGRSDFQWMEDYILARVPERVRNAHR